MHLRKVNSYSRKTMIQMSGVYSEARTLILLAIVITTWLTEVTDSRSMFLTIMYIILLVHQDPIFPEQVLLYLAMASPADQSEIISHQEREFYCMKMARQQSLQWIHIMQHLEELTYQLTQTKITYMANHQLTLEDRSFLFKLLITPEVLELNTGEI